MKEIVLGQGWLPWDRSSGEERLFLKALLIAMGVSLLLGALVPLLNVPEKRREEAEAIPLRLARMVNERQKAPEPPRVEKRVEEKEKPQQQLEQVPMSAARRKAASTGLLAMSSQLEALSSLGVLDKATSSSVLSSGGSQVVYSESAMVSNATAGSSGIDTASLVREKQEVKRPDHTTTQVELSKDDAARVQKQVAQSSIEPMREVPKREVKRDQDTISETLDRNKGAVYAIYNRALRTNAMLSGSVVFSITIEPSGKVSDCHVVSSELNDADLERKLAARIAMINFGAEAVPQRVVVWPINFLPN